MDSASLRSPWPLKIRSGKNFLLLEKEVFWMGSEKSFQTPPHPPTEEIKRSEVLLDSLLSAVEIRLMRCSNPCFEAQTFL